ncbi:hypothetical protein AVEN_144152-1 [Araneus ventricosus]|uniref:Uncharacterized protein n=1 Tax=Araneus ventricosus TaxID=182803 RepID=A0A4Y2IE85_ARAVE|nr:hypothetical protein AVEN_144152-1 [Araneus ventricosus]
MFGITSTGPIVLLHSIVYSQNPIEWRVKAVQQCRILFFIKRRHTTNAVVSSDGGVLPSICRFLLPFLYVVTLLFPGITGCLLSYFATRLSFQELISNKIKSNRDISHCGITKKWTDFVMCEHNLNMDYTALLENPDAATDELRVKG